DGRLRHLLVVDQRALDLDRRDAMARDVHHVVNTTEQPEVSVLVDPRSVSGEVDVVVLRPVRVTEPLIVLVDAAEHRGPRPLQHEVSPASRTYLVAALAVH